MKLLVCGGRNFHDYKSVKMVLDSYLAAHPKLHIAQGGARGADSLAAEWAVNNNVRVSTFHADWATHGNSAGVKRNARMLRLFQPDEVLAFPGGKGTAHMCSIASKAGVHVRSALVMSPLDIVFEHERVAQQETPQTDESYELPTIARDPLPYWKNKT